MQKVRLSAPLAGLLLLGATCSAASIGAVKDDKPSGGRACVQDDKGNLVCGKIVVAPGPPTLPTALDLLLPPVPPKFHEVSDDSGEFRMLLPWDLFSLPSILDGFSDESLSFPLDEIIRDMGKAQPNCAPIPGQVMDGKLTMDCFMAGDDLPGPVSMHVTYDLSDLPDDFSIQDLVSRRGLGMLFPPPLWQMLADSMPSQPAQAVPLIAPPKIASSPTRQPDKTDKDKSKVSFFFATIIAISSFHINLKSGISHLSVCSFTSMCVELMEVFFVIYQDERSEAQGVGPDLTQLGLTNLFYNLQGFSLISGRQ